MRRNNLLVVLLIGAICFVGAAFAARHFLNNSGSADTADGRSIKSARSTGAVPIGGPFALTDQTGKRRTYRDFRGKLVLVFFGFTQCPDVCPTTLQTASQALQKLGDAADKVRVLFITVDPERDSVAQLARYHDAFDPRIVMLTGTPQEIAKAAKTWRVYYAKKKQGDGPGDYTMAHTALSYLMGRDGRYLTHFPHKITPDDLAAAIRKHF